MAHLRAYVGHMYLIPACTYILILALIDAENKDRKSFDFGTKTNNALCNATIRLQYKPLITKLVVSRDRRLLSKQQGDREECAEGEKISQVR